MDTLKMKEQKPSEPVDSGEKDARKRDEVVKRMLATPYRPHAADKKRKPKS